MSLIETIRKDQMKARVNARKNPENNSQKIIVSVLTTFIGEADKSAKLVDGVKTVSDESVIALAKKFIKNCNEVVKASELGDARQAEAFIEIQVLEGYLPTQMSEDELRANIQTIIDGIEGADMKAMGRVMGTMKKEFGDTFDGASASKITRELLNK